MTVVRTVKGCDYCGGFLKDCPMCGSKGEVISATAHCAVCGESIDIAPGAVESVRKSEAMGCVVTHPVRGSNPLTVFAMMAAHVVQFEAFDCRKVSS